MVALSGCGRTDRQGDLTGNQLSALELTVPGKPEVAVDIACPDIGTVRRKPFINRLADSQIL